MASTGNSPQAQRTIESYRKPLGYAQLTSLGSATALPSIPTGTNLVLIQAEAQNLRWRDDGTSPTSSVGMLLIANDTLMYTGDTSTIKLIQTTSGGIANITYFA